MYSFGLLITASQVQNNTRILFFFFFLSKAVKTERMKPVNALIETVGLIYIMLIGFAKLNHLWLIRKISIVSFVEMLNDAAKQ